MWFTVSIGKKKTGTKNLIVVIIDLYRQHQMAEQSFISKVE